MAATTSGTVIDLVGRKASDLNGPALFGGRTFANSWVSTLPGTKNKAYLPIITLGTLVANDAAAFSDSGTVNMQQKVITLETFKVNLQGDYSSFESMTSLANGALNTELPEAERVLYYVGQKAASELDISLWRGATATAGQIDGFEVLIAASVTAGVSGTDAVGVTATTLTSTNILGEIEKGLEASIASVRDDMDDFKIYISTSDMVKFLAGMAKANLNTGDAYVNQMGYRYMGYEVCPVQITAGTMIFARKSNLWVSMDAMSDENEARLIDLRKTTGDNRFRVILRAMLGIGIGNLNEVVRYA